MVPVMSLWMPILVSAALVFLVSFVLHMVLTYHKADHKTLPAEDDVMEALRRFNIPPGDYMVPCAGSASAMKSAEFQAKWAKGPHVLMTVMKPAPKSMGKELLLWFLYCVLVGVFAAYLTGRALAPGAEYRAAFRFAGTTAFVGYGLALIQSSIWYKRSWGTTGRALLDGLIYGLVTGGVFGWLWPN